MQIPSAGRGRILATVLIVGISVMGAQSMGQTISHNDLPGELAPILPPPAGASGDRIFAELVRQNELRSARLQEYSAVRTYSVTNLTGKVHAREIVRMEYVAPDKKTFVTISEEGSYAVRYMVLNRLTETETLTAAGKQRHDSSITPANYTLRLLGHEDLGDHHCFVVEAIPKRHDKYLFEGRVWIDDHDFAIVRIAGHPASSLSFWIKRADFVRQYEKVGDFWLPAKDETFVDVKLYGSKILTIEHHIDTVNGVKSPALEGQNSNVAGVPE